MEPTIKIKSVIKVYPKTEHLFQITNELNPSEILKIIMAAVEVSSKIQSPRQQNFSPYSRVSSCGFACTNPKLLSLDEYRKILVQGAIRGSLENFLYALSTNALKGFRSSLSQYFPSKGLKSKEDLIKELLQKPEGLADTTLASKFAAASCTDLGSLRRENLRISEGADSGHHELIFGTYKIPTLLPTSKIQFWQIYPDSLSQNIESKPGLEFFLAENSKIANNICLLNLQEEKVAEILEKYIAQKQYSEEEFEILALTRQVDSKLLEKDFRIGKFEVHWPNQQKELTEKFGQGKKTKFETLKYGLSLVDRLKPTRELLKFFIGKKVYLYLKRGWELPFIGIPIESKVLEVLILHLKLEYLQGNVAICQVQDEMTDEVLALIWEKTESGRFRAAHFTGTQLTD